MTPEDKIIEELKRRNAICYDLQMQFYKAGNAQTAMFQKSISNELTEIVTWCIKQKITRRGMYVVKKRKFKNLMERK